MTAIESRQGGEMGWCARPRVRCRLADGNGIEDIGGHGRWQAKLASLVAMSDEELATHDVARLHMLCAAELPGAEGIDADVCVGRLENCTNGSVCQFAHIV